MVFKTFGARGDAELVVQAVTYSMDEVAGVTLLAVAGAVSIAAILAFTTTLLLRPKTYHRTHIFSYLASLLLANVLQSIGTIMNARWVRLGGVVNDGFCHTQGGIKNAGNLGTALWSFLIAMHVFNLLFLRWKTTRVGLYATLIGGWSLVAFVVIIGPTAIQTPRKGSYFGISGYWCWITDAYPDAQTFLEYFMEFVSAGLGFVLYALVLLRVRGNLLVVDGRYSLRWVPRGQTWQLSFSRDIIDSAMLGVAANMVWYPVAYSLLLIPIALARLSSFTGHAVPFWATITADVIFNLTGLVNALLFMITRRLLPDTSALPEFTTPRKPTEAHGITPFVLPPKSAAEEAFASSPVSMLQDEKENIADAGLRFDHPRSPGTLSRTSTIESWESVGSTAPLRGRESA